MDPFVGTTRWHRERRKEAYHRRAKQEGYRARSAYKLQQIHNRFHVLKKGMAVADLGCAPGGWSQVLAEAVGPEGFVLGVDLRRVRPLPGVRFIVGDLRTPETHQRIAEELDKAGREHFDAVVSDMAPDMSGAYGVDQARSAHLAGMAMEAATRHLRPGGNFVCKVFEGADLGELREEARERFRQVRQFHPPASRKQSSEVYLVAKGFRGRADDEEE